MLAAFVHDAFYNRDGEPDQCGFAGKCAEGTKGGSGKTGD